MPADLATRTLFILPERLTQAQFFASLARFTLNNWDPYPTIVSPWTPSPVPAEYDPTGPGIDMDLQYLYIVVLSLGGYEAVETTQRWNLVALSMSIWPEEQGLTKELYQRYLLFYEVYSRQVRRLFVARKRKDRDPREYSAQALSRGQEENDREDYHVSCLPWLALESRVECERQGVLDGSIVLSDYFSLSPAVQLFIKQQTYLESLEVFTNPAEGPSALFHAPPSICPSSAPSLGKPQDHDHSLDDDAFLSEDTREHKALILAENRHHVMMTQIYMLPQRLPEVSQTDIARFMYDEVNISRRRRRGKNRTKVDPRSDIMVQNGFAEDSEGLGTVQQYIPRGDSQDGDEGLTLSEFLDRDCMIGEAETKNWQKELAEKYGLKPRTYEPIGVPRVKKKVLNFQEYILAHGLHAPEVKHFFNERLKLEGGFWEHELERMQALEKRVRGEKEIPSKGWDKVSSDGSITGSDDSYETDSPIRPPPGVMQRPMSLHEYARRVIKYGKQPMEWGIITPASSPSRTTRSTPPRRQATNISKFYMSAKGGVQAPDHFESDYTEELETSHGTEHSFGSISSCTPAPTLSVLSADGSQVGGRTFSPTAPATLSHISTSLSGRDTLIYPVVGCNNGARKILSLPSGVQMDITNLNPGNPPSYNYTQTWLQQRASSDTRALQSQQSIKEHDAKMRLPSGYLPNWGKDTTDDALCRPIPFKMRQAKPLNEKFTDIHDLVEKTIAAYSSIDGRLVAQRRQASEESHRSRVRVSAGRPFTSERLLEEEEEESMERYSDHKDGEEEEGHSDEGYMFGFG